MWSCLFVGFVEKDDISPYDGFESVEERNRGEDPSRVFYFPRLQGYRSSSTTVKEDETTRPLAPFRGEKVGATLPNSRFSFSALFSRSPSPFALEKVALGHEKHQLQKSRKARGGRIDRAARSMILRIMPETSRNEIVGSRSAARGSRSQRKRNNKSKVYRGC